MQPGQDLPPSDIQTAAGFAAWKFSGGATLEEAVAYAELKTGVPLSQREQTQVMRYAQQALSLQAALSFLPPDTPMGEVFRAAGIESPEVGVRMLVEGVSEGGRVVRTGSAVVDATPEMTIGEVEELAESRVSGLYDSGGVEKWQITPLPSVPFPQQSRQ